MTDMTAARVLVCGGRDYTDEEQIHRTLRHIDTMRGPIDVLIHGAAPGADRIAGEWAEAHGVIPIACPADWDCYGLAAGPIRNAAMLKHEPRLVVAFGGGRGTGDMIRRAKAAGIEVIEVDR